MIIHLEVWAPNIYPAQAEPQPLAAFHPLLWPEDLSDPPPPDPIWDRWRQGFFREVRSREFRWSRPPPPLHPPCALHPPDLGESLASLLSTPVTVPGPMRGAGSVGFALVGCNPRSPLEYAPAHRSPGLSSSYAAGRACQRGPAQLNG